MPREIVIFPTMPGVEFGTLKGSSHPPFLYLLLKTHYDGVFSVAVLGRSWKQICNHAGN